MNQLTQKKRISRAKHWPNMGISRKLHSFYMYHVRSQVVVGQKGTTLRYLKGPHTQPTDFQCVDATSLALRFMDPVVCESKISSIGEYMSELWRTNSSNVWYVAVINSHLWWSHHSWLLISRILISPSSPSIFPVRSSLNPRNLCWSANVFVLRAIQKGRPKISGGTENPTIVLGRWVLVQSYACLFPFNAGIWSATTVVAFGDSMGLPDMAWCTHMSSSTSRQKNLHAPYEIPIWRNPIMHINVI